MTSEKARMLAAVTTEPALNSSALFAGYTPGSVKFEISLSCETGC